MKLTVSYLPSLLLAFGLGLGIWSVRWVLIARRHDLSNERKFPRQLILLALSFIAVVVVILVLPIGENSRNKLFGLVGLLVSGTIAFSSTGLLSNFMGGVLLRSTKSFNIGDFIRVEQHFGRVTERGLFDTEMQTEARELISLPNAYLISHPITTTRRSGAIVSTTLSLGYDVHHSLVEPLLLSAADAIGLKESWVLVLEMGNFSVTYRVSGLLEDIELLITAHSNLRRSVLDTLHDHGVEIMSPSYMNQRRSVEGETTIPPTRVVPSPAEFKGGEHVAFDKAKEASEKEDEKQRLTIEIQELQEVPKELAEQDEAERLARLDSARGRLKSLDESELSPALADGPVE